jgi:AAA family ATP:ADP antiporter
MMMKTGIGRLLQIDTGNRQMIAALLLQAGCTGLFAGTLELAGNAMFLESHGAEQIPLALMVSGGAGILIAAIYSYFSKQLGVKSFGILNLVAVVAITTVLLLGSHFLKKPVFDFLLFVLMGPMLLITLLGFWVTVRGFLSPSKSKQLSGLIEVALVAGMVIAFAGMPILIRRGLQVRYVLYPGMGSLILATGAQLFVLVGMGRNRVFSDRRVSSTGPIRLFSHRYTGLISAFMVLGVAVSMVLHFSFLWAASDQYTAGIELVSFLGFFLGAIIMISWIMKRFLFGWVKKRFSLGVTLLMSPVILLLLSMTSVIMGDFYDIGAETSLFTYFFLFVALTRFVGGAWKGSMEEASMNVIYQSLDPREKHNIKSGIEGMLSQIGVFTIGLFLACFVLISFIEIIHVTYLLITLIMAWFFVGLALYRSYRKMLKVSLESDRIRDQLDRRLEDLAKVDLKRTPFSLEAIEFNPYFFHYTPGEVLHSLLEHPHTGVRIRAWDHLLGSSPGLPQLTISQMLVREHEPVVKERIRQMAKRKLRSKLGLQEAFIRERLDRFTDDNREVDPAVGEAFHSGVRNEVFAALYHVARERDRTYISEVVDLLKEQDLVLRSVAISTAGKLDSRGVTNSLIDCLVHPELYAHAWSALVSQGEVVLEDLEAAFHKHGSGIKIQKRIISVFSAIGGEKAMQHLIDKLDYHHREVFYSVVLGLYENHFHASEIEITNIQAAILKLVQTGAWNLAAKISVRMENPGGYLDIAIDHEIWDVNEVILMLLAMIYDRRSVNRIRMNLLDKQAEDRGMAIELLDLLLNEPLKTVLMSYFIDILVREKIDKLQSLFRIDLIPVNLLLRKILNRDGMQMGDFIRVCVLERMGNVDRYFDEQQIIAQGFHPNPKIRETAAQILRKNDPGRYDMVTERLDFIDNSFPDHDDLTGWYVNTTINLASWELFKNVGINSLFKLVSVLQPFSEEILAEGDHVLLARSVDAGDFTPLSTGIAIIADHQPEILEQIRYLGTDSKSEAYLIERGEFIELLFDNRSLLHVFCAF